MRLATKQHTTMKTLNDEGSGATFGPGPGSRSRPLTKSELRKENRQKTFARVEKSATVAAQYPQLKTLAVDQLYFDRDIISRGHGLRYRANLETAKSMLHFHCPSGMCKDGGFDLSKYLSSAVAGHQKSVEGKVRCLGFRDQPTGQPAPCESVLHFKMNLTFKTKTAPRRRITARKPGPKPGLSRLQI
jgi:hypothetical protein